MNIASLQKIVNIKTNGRRIDTASYSGFTSTGITVNNAR
ncbi:MAG: hypothetical protein ACI87J_001742 [Colwellia sp.]|jgi:hypothetical protein